MSKGIIQLVGLAITLAFAIPIALFGFHRLAAGETVVGAGALAVSVLMVVLQEHLTTPADVPGKAVETVVGTVLKEPEDADPDAGRTQNPDPEE